MRSGSDCINIDDIKSFKTILAKLAELENTIPHNGLDQFIVFNKAYSIVTSRIEQASENGYFENSKFVEKFTICFARYYFQAINETMGHKPELPAAWQMANKASEYKTAPNFIFLLMGANAHINHDLPLALLKIMGGKEPVGLVKDIFKIDRLLMKSGREIAGTFEESNQLLDLLKRHLFFLYYRPVMYMVLYWRIKAWRNYKSIKKDGIKNSAYAKTSIKISKRFLKLAKLSARYY